MEFSSQMILFAKVVEYRSFAAAARALGQTPSTVSRQIGHLEDRIGVRLLNRQPNGVSPTAEGKAFHERCVDVSARISEAESFATSIGGNPRGKLCVVATVAFANVQLLPVLPDFLARYPEVQLSLDLNDRAVDLVADEIDLAIRFTEQVDNTSVIARKLATNRRVICAAPGYIERFGVPERPRDLVNHNCLRLSTVTRWNDWHLDDPAAGEPILLGGNFEASSADGIYHAALAGVGIARLSTYLVGDDLRCGRLVRLLSDYTDETSNILAVYPEKRNVSPKVRAFIDHLVDCFGPVPPWER